MANKSENGDKTLLPHHVQQELCTTRPLYRQGRKLTAIKVYTINNESQHLLIFQVPKINLSTELRNLCSKYGELRKFQAVTDRQTEIFTECYHAQYQRIQSARIAKRLLDNKSFYGDVLHVCYAPEYETVAETRDKLQQRKKDVLSRLQPGPSTLEYLNVQRDNGPSSSQNRKRKCPALPITEKRLKAENSTDIWMGIPAELDPRILAGSQDAKTGFKKHFQLPQPKGVEYGPYIPPNIDNTEPDNVNIPTKKSDTVRTTLLPTTVIKNYKHECTKRIVFRNKKET